MEAVDTRSPAAKLSALLTEPGIMVAPHVFDWFSLRLVELLGVRAVIEDSFERFHRSKQVGMGVLPLQFPPGMSPRGLGLTGAETFDVADTAAALVPGAIVPVLVNCASGLAETVHLLSRVDTRREAEWVRNGGILPYVMNELAAA
jgi:aconitate hydratase